MNVSKLTGAESFTLAPGHELRRGTPAEVATIKMLLQQYMPVQALVWECRQEGDSSWVRTENEENWQYFVLSFQGLNRTLIEIEDALILAPLELKLAFTVVAKRVPEPPEVDRWFGPGVLIHPVRFFYQTWGGLSLFHTPLFEVTAADIDEMLLLHRQIQKHDERLLDVKRLVGQLHDLEGLPPDSPLFFLGYFGVLESLLVHPPKPSDPYDSITRQVKQKIALLSRRSKFAIDYDSFGEAKPDTVWTRMYKYRSELAHGGAPTFTGELQVLGTRFKAQQLLKQTVRMLIRQSLIEPQLFVDLREC